MPPRPSLSLSSVAVADAAVASSVAATGDGGRRIMHDGRQAAGDGGGGGGGSHLRCTEYGLRGAMPPSPSILPLLLLLLLLPPPPVLLLIQTTAGDGRCIIGGQRAQGCNAPEPVVVIAAAVAFSVHGATRGQSCSKL